MVTEVAVPAYIRFSRVQYVTEHLASDFDIHIVCIKSPIGDAIEGAHLHPIEVEWRQFDPMVRFVSQKKLITEAKSVCKKYKIDLVCGEWSISFASAKLAKKPLLANMSDFAEDLYESFGFPFARVLSPCVRSIQTFVANKSEACIVESEVAREIWSARGIPKEKLHPVPHGVKADLFRSAKPNRMRERFGIPEDAITVTYHGDIGFDDGVDLLVRAVSDLNVWCLCVGPGRRDYLDYLRSISNTRTIIAGWMPYQEMPHLLAAADISVSPFRSTIYTNTVFPTKTMEAMAAGKATICSRLKAFSKAVKDGVDIRLVRPDNVESLRLAIKELAEDENLRKRLGANARRTAVSKFDWSIRARQEAEAIRKIIG